MARQNHKEPAFMILSLTFSESGQFPIFNPFCRNQKLTARTSARKVSDLSAGLDTIELSVIEIDDW
jgi:hypothetical protein